MVSIELIKVDQVKQTVDARELHAFLGVETRWDKWVQRRIEEYGFTQPVDFIAVKNDLNEFKDFRMSLEMAKELCMVERTEKGRQARKYFIEVEKKWREKNKAMSSLQVLQEAVNQLVEQETRLRDAEHRLDKQEERIALLAADTEYRSIRAYARIKGYKVDLESAKRIGKKATEISKARGIHIGVVPDERHGRVNSYHVSILTPIMDAWNAGVL